MAFSATRSIHHPLAALEAQVVDLQQRLAIKEAEIVAEQNRRSSERKAASCVLRNTQYAIRNEPHSQLRIMLYAMPPPKCAIRSTQPCSQPVVYYAIRNTQYATMLTANHVIRRAFCASQNTQEADNTQENNTQRKPYCP